MLFQLRNVGPKIGEIQRLLKQEGFFDYPINNTFDEYTKSQVEYFQSTHNNKDKKMLDIDGKVGNETWWALNHASGEYQTLHIIDNALKINSNLKLLPGKLTPMRMAVGEIAFREYNFKVKEEPNGSNWGNRIPLYGGRPGWAWCLLFALFCEREGGAEIPKRDGTNKIFASCWQFYKYAKTQKNWVYPISSKDPRARLPMNIVLWLHSGGKGHAGIAMGFNKNLETFNTIEGNKGNRLAFVERNTKSKDLTCMINPFPDEEQPFDFERKLIKAKSGEGGNTR